MLAWNLKLYLLTVLYLCHTFRVRFVALKVRLWSRLETTTLDFRLSTDKFKLKQKHTHTHINKVLTNPQYWFVVALTCSEGRPVPLRDWRPS